MAVRALALLALLWVAACGGGGGGKDAGVFSIGDAGPRHECIDEDDDGFGFDCGRDVEIDCDDDDPNITDECLLCTRPSFEADGKTAGCPCEPGTKPLTTCKPPDVRVVLKGVTGVIQCKYGTRYCRDGLWSECERLEQYATFVPD